LKSIAAQIHKGDIDRNTTLFWFRRDLRIKDNAGLYHALKENDRVLCLFIFDTNILGRLEQKDARIEFIHHSLSLLKTDLEKQGSSLLVFHGDPIRFFEAIKPKNVYTNHDYEPYARSRDEKVKKALDKNGVPLLSFKDQVIFEKDEIIKDNGEPYTVFTPYGRKWKATLTKFYLNAYPNKKYFRNFKQVRALLFPDLGELGFEETGLSFPERKIKTSTINYYHKNRNFPAKQSTTHLSVHLRFGTVSIRKLAAIAINKNETWLNELIWRDFYQMILWHFPHVEKHSFKPAYNDIQWRNNEAEFKTWCEGRTGYPIVDAGMRELNTTGFMHNRVRMITASFLTKHLLIDWRWGEAYFAEKLLDYDLAANNGGWQWAAGSGCDAAPYFRIFNPELQTLKFDPDKAYIKKWIPELDTDRYPKPIVSHKGARERALKTYTAALNKE
jgi:deoxyribodipyrimidine photo-lyase